MTTKTTCDERETLLQKAIDAAFEDGTAFELSLYYASIDFALESALWDALEPAQSGYCNTNFMIACFELCYLGREDEF